MRNSRNKFKVHNTPNTVMVETEDMKEIVDFLSTNREARDEALTIILSFTATMVNRRKFLPTDVIKQLLRLIADCIDDEPITSKAF
jgi:hypothetical protein